MRSRLSEPRLALRLWIQCGRQGAAAKIVQHEETNRRRQIALLAVAVDLAHQFGQRHVSQSRNFLHAIPERLFEADAGFVTGDHDRAFHHGRFHDASSPSMRCWSSTSLARVVRRSSRTRSDLVRPNRARLASACFADCSRSVRFLNRSRLTTSPMSTPHPTNRGRATFSRRRKWSRWAASVVIQKSPLLPSDSIKKNVSLCENEIFCALSRRSATTIAHRSQSLGVMAYNYFPASNFPGLRCAAISRGVSFCPAAPAGRIHQQKQSPAAPPL